MGKLVHVLIPAPAQALFFETDDGPPQRPGSLGVVPQQARASSAG